MPLDGTDFSEAAQAIILIEMAEAYLQGGKYWIRGHYRYGKRRCMIDALEEAAKTTRFTVQRARYYLVLAIDPHYASVTQSKPLFWRGRIIRFNDTEVTSYSDIRKVFMLARQYAERDETTNAF